MCYIYIVNISIMCTYPIEKCLIMCYIYNIELLILCEIFLLKLLIMCIGGTYATKNI